MDFPRNFPLLTQEGYGQTGSRKQAHKHMHALNMHARKHTHTHTHHVVPAEPVKNAKFRPKTNFVCKANFYKFKNKSAGVYLCKAFYYILGNFSPKQKFMYVIVFGRTGTFRAGGRFKNPCKTKETIATTELFPL